MISLENQQANVKAKSAVKRAKWLMRKTDNHMDQFQALLDVRITPTKGMGKNIEGTEEAKKIV